MRVLLSDGLHFSKKNFASLLCYLDETGAVITYPEFKNDSICRFGDYSRWPGILATGHAMSNLTADELFNCTYKNINLFEVARAELMSKCAVQEHWLNAPGYGSSVRALFDKLFVNDNEDLRLNIASARYWAEYWFNLLSSKTFDAVFIFSGALTYATALTEVMKCFPGRVYVFESFFTGRHYYCEEKYTHLPNNTDARFRHLLISGTPSGTVIDQARLEYGIKNALAIQNKNVSQPASLKGRLFTNGKQTVLIGGQVLNDFSLLKTTRTGIHSVSVYRSVIERLLAETSVNIIFKAHPWENKKNNLFTAKTRMCIEHHFGNCSRVAIVEDYAVSDLFSEVDYVFVINSQLGIEAALHGFKPLQMGSAFYGQYGFTWDVDSPGDVVTLIKNQSGGRLSVQEYITFREYMMYMLVDWLVPEDETTGKVRLRQIFKVRPVKKAVSPVKEDSASTGGNRNVPTEKTHQTGTWHPVIRKMIKLRREPKRFLSDSSYSILRVMSKIL
ncbi:hypothetical protein GW742_18815 [Citrobacter freundii]|nr:hypothetical protein [Citrobacter freundii]MBC6508492.1 hypothetical protein [Citrobacter freundii]